MEAPNGPTEVRTSVSPSFRPLKTHNTQQPDTNARLPLSRLGTIKRDERGGGGRLDPWREPTGFRERRQAACEAKVGPACLDS